MIYSESRTTSNLTAEAVGEVKSKLYDTINQTEPDLEVQMDEITEDLDSLAVKDSPISQDQHPDGLSSLQDLERQKRVLGEDRLALEAEKKAIEQSHQACETARKWLEAATPQLDSGSVHIDFSGANNKGFQLGQNTGFISNFKFGPQP